MAKFASNFTAWVLVLVVKPEFFAPTVKYIKELMSVSPRWLGYDEKCNLLLVVEVPCCTCREPDRDFLDRRLKALGVRIKSQAKKKSICPPGNVLQVSIGKTAPLDVNKQQYGICPNCGEQRPLIARPPFVMADHGDGQGRCRGSGLAPKPKEG